MRLCEMTADESRLDEGITTCDFGEIHSGLSVFLELINHRQGRRTGCLYANDGDPLISHGHDVTP